MSKELNESAEQVMKMQTIIIFGLTNPVVTDHESKR